MRRRMKAAELLKQDVSRSEVACHALRRPKRAKRVGSSDAHLGAARTDTGAAISPQPADARGRCPYHLLEFLFPALPRHRSHRPGGGFPGLSAAPPVGQVARGPGPRQHSSQPAGRPAVAGQRGGLVPDYLPAHAPEPNPVEHTSAYRRHHDPAQLLPARLRPAHLPSSPRPAPHAPPPAPLGRSFRQHADPTSASILWPAQ